MSAQMKIGIDLGGTKTEAILLSHDDKLIKKVRVSTPVEHGYSAILNNIETIVGELEKHAGSQCTVGIGTPGSMDRHTNLLKNSNTVCLNGRPLLSDLEILLNRPVRIENDANCFALSEAIDGSGKNHRTVFGVIMGTGVGGGIIMDKSIINGPNGMTGEWGHTVLDADGDACYCGLNGCIETFLSGPGLVRHFINNGGSSISSVEDLLSQADNNNPIAIKTVDQYYTDFARAISQVVKFLDPDVIVLGGGLSNIDTLYTTAAERINNYFAYPVSVKLKRNTHGDSSGVRGAAFLWGY